MIGEYTLADKPQLKAYMQSYHNIKCPNCHIEMLIGKDMHCFYCVLCDKRFTTESVIEAHVKKDHSPTIFNCNECECGSHLD